MKLTLTIEDTTRGILTRVQGDTNGCSDHRPDSLSLMVMGQLLFHIRRLYNAESLHVEGDALKLTEK
jgi:hypothetical protein